MQLPLITVRKRIFGHFPWGMFVLLLCWMGIGLINLYSASLHLNETGLPSLFKTQLLWMGVGMVVLLGITLVDYHFLFPWAYPLYIISILLLLLVFIPGLGKSVAGQQNWISIKGFRLQPSEFAKLGVILALSRYYSRYPLNHLFSVKDLLPAFALVVVPLGLILLQKDLGSSLFFGLLFITLTFFIRLPGRVVLIAGLLVLVGGVGVYQYGLKNYQKDRIRTFLNPESDAKGKGYHLVQSKIAVGSGGLWGKGYLRGNVNKLKYLPEKHTDFIFPVLAEEWGLVGSVITLLVMVGFLLLGLESASQCKEAFGCFLTIGVMGLFFWHVVINLGGVLGLIPLTGVPLPLLSYGGSSVLTLLTGAGLLMNVRMRRFFF